MYEHEQYVDITKVLLSLDLLCPIVDVHLVLVTLLEVALDLLAEYDRSILAVLTEDKTGCTRPYTSYLFLILDANGLTILYCLRRDGVFLLLNYVSSAYSVNIKKIEQIPIYVW